jgi:hypothetical protein
MKRDQFIQELARFLSTFPKGASDYHICDMLISKAERMGMAPPEVEIPVRNPDPCSVMDALGYSRDKIREWEDEDEGDYL